MASNYRKQVNAWLAAQSFQAGTVLDVGGSQKSITTFTKVASPRFVTLDTNPKADIVHDLNVWAHPDDLFGAERQARFDLIFCMHVFEYIHNPYNAIANLYSWLAKGGTVVANFPFLYPLHDPEGIDYLRYTHEWIDRVFREQFKFSRVETTILTAGPGAAALQEFYRLEGMHTRKDDSWAEIGCIVKAVR